MTHIPPASPNNLEPAGQWLKEGPCREDPEAMYPGTLEAEIETAKATCRRCPVVDRCLQWALETGEAWGVWGGLTEKERASILRAKTRLNLTPAAIQARAEEARRPPKPPRTMQSVFDESTTRLYNGHLAWTGLSEVKFDGRKYSPKQLAFTLDRGHFPEGKVLVDCRVAECVLARHLADQAERAQWGSPVKAVAS